MEYFCWRYNVQEWKFHDHGGKNKLNQWLRSKRCKRQNSKVEGDPHWYKNKAILIFIFLSYNWRMTFHSLRNRTIFNIYKKINNIFGKTFIKIIEILGIFCCRHNVQEWKFYYVHDFKNKLEEWLRSERCKKTN